VFLYGCSSYKGQQEALELKRTNVPARQARSRRPAAPGRAGFSDKHPIDDLKDLRDAYRAA
jgi:hypothetical protein